MITNITLIGMPGAGKSTVGIILAKRLSMEFIDTDVLIQARQHRTLQEILDREGHLRLREIEQQEILRLAVDRHVIATGGSAVYSAAAMRHLRERSWIVFLRVSLAVIQRRVHDFGNRGLARPPQQSLPDLFAERQALYQTYAQFTIDVDALDQDQVSEAVAVQWSARPGPAL